MMTYEQIKELIRLVSELRLHELEIERSGFRLKISGVASGVRASAESRPADSAAAGAVSVAQPNPGDFSVAAPAGEASAAGPAGAAGSIVRPTASAAGLHVVNSPIVGTFYLSPSPEAEAFVRVGDRVRKGQVLCIVEAMKLMNEIESDVDGVIAEVHPRNAQPVEFGEPLFSVRPD